MDLHELERVQRLCILAWMKAVDWEIFKVRAEHKSTSSVHVSPSAGSRQPSEQSHCFVFFFFSRMQRPRFLCHGLSGRVSVYSELARLSERACARSWPG